tara:strand:+ start:127 stop:474 length:348 start_codon:yes stop_codon:yes gene_type:complete
MSNILYIYDPATDEETEVVLPTKCAVCDVCNGKGSVGHPAYDGMPISIFNDDPEHADDYFSGRLDVTCPECSGKRVVDVVDTERMSAEHVELWYQQLEAERDSYLERQAERRMGA